MPAGVIPPSCVIWRQLQEYPNVCSRNQQMCCTSLPSAPLRYRQMRLGHRCQNATCLSAVLRPSPVRRICPGMLFQRQDRIERAACTSLLLKCSKTAPGGHNRLQHIAADGDVHLFQP